MLAYTETATDSDYGRFRLSYFVSLKDVHAHQADGEYEIIADRSGRRRCSLWTKKLISEGMHARGIEEKSNCMEVHK